MRLRTAAGVWTGAIALGAAILATSASADTINVPGNNNKSIQDGVDLADPGDTVRISPKRRSYFENVVVTTNRIRLLGVTRKGKRPVIDGTSVDGTTDGLNLDIDANRVSVVNIGSRHGNGIDCTGDNCRFERVAVSMSDQSGDCVEIIGNASSVVRSSLVGCDDQAVDIDGNGARITGNSMRQSDNGCAEVDGDRLRFLNNRVHNCEDGEGLDFSGDDAALEGNAVANTDSDSFEIDGDRNLLRNNSGRNNDDLCFDVNGIGVRLVRNRAAACGGGFEIDGENMKVIRNRAVDISDDEGFDIGCFDDAGGAPPAEACARAVVRGNFAADAADDDEGFEIDDSATDGGMEISGNVSEDNNDGGYDIDTDDAEISGNASRRDGAEGNEPGFEIDGAANLIQENTVSSSGDDGLGVDGADNRVLRNVVRRSNVDGIQIDGGGTDVIVRGNRALGNFGDGIENDGTDTRLIDNTASGNRRDCVNDGTVAQKQGNRCADGSNFNQPGTVDRRRP